MKMIDIHDINDINDRMKPENTIKGSPPNIRLEPVAHLCGAC